MRPLLSLLIAFFALSLVPGCVRRFEEARPDEPHAIVKIHIVHHTLSGPQLSQRAQWNGHDVAVPWGAAGVSREGLRAVRVRPEPARWSIDTEYFHLVTRMAMQTVYRPESYSCGTTTIGSGQYARSMPRTCTRQVPEQRLVTVVDHITDGACSQALAHTPIAGAVYLLQYDYYGPGHCSAQCLRQLRAPDGSFRLVPCGAGEPPPESSFPTSGAEHLLASPVRR